MVDIVRLYIQGVELYRFYASDFEDSAFERRVVGRKAEGSGGKSLRAARSAYNSRSADFSNSVIGSSI